MPKGQIKKIKLISKFLDKTKVINFDKLDTMDSVLSLPISTLNFLNDADVDLIYNLFQISSISQFSSLDPTQPLSPYINIKIRKQREKSSIYYTQI